VLILIPPPKKPSTTLLEAARPGGVVVEMMVTIPSFSRALLLKQDQPVRERLTRIPAALKQLP
jgi:hypothetical protein